MGLRIKNWFICWWSHWYSDIHTPADSLKGVPDNWGEYECARCGKLFK